MASISMPASNRRQQTTDKQLHIVRGDRLLNRSTLRHGERERLLAEDLLLRLRSRYRQRRVRIVLRGDDHGIDTPVGKDSTGLGRAIGGPSGIP